MKYIEMKAPAKINIGLNIVSKRPDGYHNLETFFYPIKDLYDVIKIRKSDKFSFHSNISEQVNDLDNLIVKTVQLLEKEYDFTADLEIKLEKRIPMGAGLGGGSSDAAAMILALNDMFRLKMDFPTMKKHALELGSDVPFFLKIKPAIGRSRGEELTFVETEITKPIVIVNPGIHISTKEAFSHISPKPSGFEYESLSSLLSKDISGLRAIINNDFEDYVFKKYEEVGRIKETLYSSGALFALMTGSGSTVFGIFDQLSDAENCLNALSDKYFKFISFRES